MSEKVDWADIEEDDHEVYYFINLYYKERLNLKKR